MKVKQKWIISFLFLFIFTLAACSGETTSPDSESDNGSGSDSDSVSEGASEAQEVIIGYSGPLSGPAVQYGERTINGLEMAIEAINGTDGFEVDGQTYQLKLSTLDDKYSPNETGTNAKRLSEEEGANFVFTPHSGGVKAMQVFNEQNDFIIIAYTSEPEIIEVGNSLTWRLPPGYDVYIEPWIKYQMDEFGDTIAFLPTASEYGKDWAELLKPAWEESGGEVVFETSIDFDQDTDYSTPVTNALQENPDVLFVGGPSEPTALVVKQARDLGFDGGVMIMDQAKLDEMDAVLDGNTELLEGSIGVAPLIYSDYPGTDDFVDKYRELHDVDPGSEAGLSYISMFGLVEAMKVAGTVDDTQAIMEALDEGVQNIPEEEQVYTIDGVDENGANIVPLRMAVVEDGEIKAITLEDVGLE